MLHIVQSCLQAHPFGKSFDEHSIQSNRLLSLIIGGVRTSRIFLTFIHLGIHSARDPPLLPRRHVDDDALRARAGCCVETGSAPEAPPRTEARIFLTFTTVRITTETKPRYVATPSPLHDHPVRLHCLSSHLHDDDDDDAPSARDVVGVMIPLSHNSPRTCGGFCFLSLSSHSFYDTEFSFHRGTHFR